MSECRLDSRMPELLSRGRESERRRRGKAFGFESEARFSRPSQLREETIHLSRQRRVDVDESPIVGVAKAEIGGHEEQTSDTQIFAKKTVVRPVSMFCVSYNGMRGVCEMASNLMMATGVGHRSYQ